MAVGKRFATAVAGLATGVLVIGLPISVAVAAEGGDTAKSKASSDSERIVGRFGAEESWASKGTDKSEFSQDLDRQLAAPSRAAVRAPIEVDPCLEVDTAANGSRLIVNQARTYFPLAAGSYTKSSPFGYRIHPILGTAKLHEGDDYAAPTGTPIYSVADGVVVTVGSGGTQGNYVIIEHHDEQLGSYTSHYFHQADGAIRVSEGQSVEAGDQIGGVGSTGRSTGAHLHLEIHDASGTPVVPSEWLGTMGTVHLGQDCS